VFVQHLPHDATVEEVAAVFSKAGLILVDADDKPKVKLYTDEKTGMRNGDGLVVYYKEDSVQLAVNLLDDSPLRLGDKENMKVAKAEWSHKKEEEADTTQNGEKGKGRVDPEKAQKMQRRAERLQREAADYDPSYDERESPAYLGTATGKPASSARIVVLAHVFTLEELAEDASLLLDLKEDVRDECESLGKVTNVVLYDVSTPVRL
jgi:HIV Tat-specific factor 1